MPVYDDFGWGRRWDGTYDSSGAPNMVGDYKGPGFAGGFMSDGSAITEYAAGGAGGVPQFPLVYQGIMPWEMRTIVNDAAYPGSDPVISGVEEAAYLEAIVRAGQGLPSFWQPTDGEAGILWSRKVWERR